MYWSFCLVWHLLLGWNLVTYRFVRKVVSAFAYQVATEPESLWLRLLLRHRLNFVDFVKAT